MEVRQEAMLNVRQDGVRSWCFFASNGEANLRSYGGVRWTGESMREIIGISEDLGFVYTAFTLLVAEIGAKEVSPIPGTKSSKKLYEYLCMAITKPSDVGEDLEGVILDSITPDTREMLSYHRNEKSTWYAPGKYASRKHGGVKKEKSRVETSGTPYALPGVGLYQTCVQGVELDINCFARSIGKLLRFSRNNSSTEIRIDMPKCDKQVEVAVLAIMSVLPKNVVVVRSGGEEYYNDPDLAGAYPEIETVIPVLPNVPFREKVSDPECKDEFRNCASDIYVTKEWYTGPLSA